jgi:hypothetical protein
MVTSVLEVISNVVSTVVTGGASTGVTAGSQAAQQAAKNSGKAAIAKAIKDAGLKATKSQIRDAIIKGAKDAGKSITEATITEATKAAAGEDFDWYALDPTGIASVVKAYNKPICPTPPLLALLSGANPSAGVQSASAAAGPAAFGTIVKATNADTVYLINRAGQRQPIASAQVFQACGLTWDKLKTQDPGSVNAIPMGPMLSTDAACKDARNGRIPGGVLLKTADAATVYLVDSKGSRRAISSLDVFNGCGLSWGSLATIPPALMASVQAGAVLSNVAACQAERALIK